MGSNRENSNIAIAILDKWRIWTYSISHFNINKNVFKHPQLMFKDAYSYLSLLFKLGGQKILLYRRQWNTSTRSKQFLEVSLKSEKIMLIGPQNLEYNC